MGLIAPLVEAIFGSGRNVVKETVEVFRENAEAGAVRAQATQAAALAQMSSEFGHSKTWFDSAIDGMNRLPRPLMAFGTLALFGAAMVDPIWFSERMQGLALVPEALWWLMGAIVSFYFGARHQLKGQEFQREMANTVARVPQVRANIAGLRSLRDEIPSPALRAGAAENPGSGLTDGGADVPPAAGNPALEEWRQGLH